MEPRGKKGEGDQASEEVVLDRPSAADEREDERFEIVLKGDLVVQVARSFDANALRRLLSVLREEDFAC